MVSRMRKSLVLLVTMLASLMADTGVSVTRAAGTPESGPNAQAVGVAPGPPPQLTILFTGAVTGWTEPCG
jgi:hypothetical protein